MKKTVLVIRRQTSLWQTGQLKVNKGNPPEVISEEDWVGVSTTDQFVADRTAEGLFLLVVVRTILHPVHN